MKKIIKKYGNTKVIVLDKDDLKIYNIKAGDVIDVEIVKVKVK